MGSESRWWRYGWEGAKGGAGGEATVGGALEDAEEEEESRLIKRDSGSREAATWEKEA